MTAAEYVKNLKNGWSLGNTLDSFRRNYHLPYRQETTWGNPVTTWAMIQKVKEAGFEVLRVPVTWSEHMGGAPDFTIGEKFIKRVKEVVDYGISLEMTVILNLHHDNWHYPSDEKYPAVKIQMQKVWTQIANYFSGYDNKLIFEVMNEPRKEGASGEIEWGGGDEEGRRVVMQYSQDAVDAIRATGGNNATRMLMIPTYAACVYEIALSDFSLPKGENLIVSLHGYIPYEFSLYNEMDKDVWLEKYETEIDNLFKLIDKYFISKGIPVIIGECGARRKGDNETDRAKWAAYYTKKARELDIPCLWWDCGLLEGTENMEVFGLLDRQKLEWAFPKIVKAFIG